MSLVNLQIVHEALERELEGALPLVHPGAEGEEGILRRGGRLPDVETEHGLRDAEQSQDSVWRVPDVLL